jgi:hypothetical protein
MSSFKQYVQVGLPYIRAKAQDYFEELGGGIDPEILQGSDATRHAQALTDQVSGGSVFFTSSSTGVMVKILLSVAPRAMAQVFQVVVSLDEHYL